MNRRTKAHFQYGWWVYLLIVVAAITLWVAVFAQLARPKAYEVLNITIVGEVNGDKITEDLVKELDGKTAHPLKKINVEVVSGKSLNLAEVIAMRCIGDTDLILFDEEFLFKTMSSNFKAVDGEKLNSWFGGITPYEEEDKTYGMLLYDGVSQTNFSNYYNGENKFWAFITPVSENAAKINGVGEEENDSALQAIKYLMGAN